MTEDGRTRGQLVVIGASAGGIEALSILVGTLKPDFAAPIIVAQHLDPRRESHLGDILARRTALPVVTVQDRAPLAAGTIHVIPANRHVSVADHEVALDAPPPDGGPVPSVDHVLSTAAEQFGEGLIAVILTGTGSDGADGARRVKLHGGTVVIQDPSTARFPSMPNALAPTTVDIVASIEAIGPLLHDLVAGIGPARPEEERLLESFLDELRDRTGIDFSSYKRPTILRRLQRRIAATPTEDLRSYTRYASKHPEEYQRLASSFLIKVTEFFRDPDLFDYLRDVVLPDVIAAAREQGRELRLWSAGCATGEEAFSLAMLVSEALRDELHEWTVRIFATDLDPDAIAFARRGVYGASALEHLPTELVDRYFTRVDSGYEVRKQLRALTVFGQHDLALRAPFPRIDVALCRNVLIYFTPELQRRALELFAFALRDDGWLMLGKAESTNPLAEYFALEDARLKVYRRRGERAVVPPMRTREARDGALTRLTSRVGRNTVQRQLAAPPLEPSRQRAASDRAETTLAVLPFGLVVIDRNYDIVSINPAARRLLGIHGPAIGQDLIHLAASVGTAELRDALDEALAGRAGTLRLAATMPGAGEAERTWLEIVCTPGSQDAPEGRPGGAVLAVRDVTEQVRKEMELEARIEAQRESADDRDRQLDALRETNRRLLRDNEELTVANEELRGTNEELQVANEEVQAATEEVETLNEELQATNEELETLNEELQATVEELNTTNDDMQSRAVELQEVTVNLEEQRRSAETERARLATLIETMRDGVLVVDRKGRTLIRNAAYTALFDRYLPADAPFDEDAIRARVAAGEEFVVPFVVTLRDGRRRWYEAYGRPVPAEMEIGEGGILVVHDTTDVSLRRLQQEFVGIVAHELRTPLTALRGYLQMLARQVGGERERPVRLALEQADRLHRMVEELFDVTRVERGRLVVRREPHSLGELIEQTIEIASGISDRHRFRFQRSGDDVVAVVDAGRVQQVLLNLLMNAIVHAPDAPEIDVRLRRFRRRAEIEVEDHGPGIPAEDQSALFAPFEQGRPAGHPVGLGLGLYIAREIVVAHGGSIEVDSEVGMGTTFTVRLPLSDGAEKGPRGQAATGAPAGAKRRMPAAASTDGASGDARRRAKR